MAGQIYGLHVAPGQQVSDGSILFSVKVSHLLLELFHGLYLLSFCACIFIAMKHNKQ